MKIISLLGEAEVGNKANLPIDKDLLYKARQKYPQYSGEQALTLYIADEMKEKDQIDSNQNRLLDTQRRENDRLRGIVDNLGQTVEQEIQQVAQQAEINDREISRIKQLTGTLSQGGTDTQRKAKVSSDALKLEESCEEEFNQQLENTMDKIKSITQKPASLPEPVPGFLEKSIYDLELPVRAFNCLLVYLRYKRFEEEGIKVKDIVNISLSDFMNQRNAGPISIEQIRNVLNKNGYDFKP